MLGFEPNAHMGRSHTIYTRWEGQIAPKNPLVLWKVGKGKIVTFQCPYQKIGAN